MKILAVAAHPDDIELTCAGTLARAAAVGHSIAIAHFTSGDKGGEKDDDRDVVRRTRWAEAQASADLIGARHVGGWFDDLEMYPDQALDHELSAFIVEYAPNIVFAPPPNDYHADHRLASTIVTNALQALIEKGDGFAAPAYFLTDSLGSLDFVPDSYVDISSVMSVKERMLAQHVSQVRWMGAHRGLDMALMMRSCAWYRGMQANVPFAEGFRAVGAGPEVNEARSEVLTEVVGGGRA